MSEVMTPMSFEQLVDWVLQEKKKRGTVFGQHHAYRADGTHNRTMFGRTLETPIGPAAGPHTQMTQNIVAAYYAGSRFFELKTITDHGWKSWQHASTVRVSRRMMKGI